jgi:hypothetical protein
MFMGADMFSEYFNEDCTVKEAGSTEGEAVGNRPVNI